MGILIAIAAVFMTLQAYLADKIIFMSDFRTIAFPTPDSWLDNQSLSMWINMIIILCIGAEMILINRHFNLLRTTSAFFAAYFVFTTACTPTVMGQLSASSILALITMGSVWLMFSIYGLRISTRRVFLIFFMIGMGQLIEYTFALYIPIFIAALGQMRIFGLKKILAAIMGNITPAWISWGLGIIQRPTLPHFEFTHPAQLLDTPQQWPMLAAAALTLLTGFIFGNLNLIKIIGFNAQARAYNGILIMLSISTGLFAIVNFTNLPFYMTLLNACVAFQVGHFFRFTVMRRGYIAVVTLMASYLAIYLWAMMG